MKIYFGQIYILKSILIDIIYFIYSLASFYGKSYKLKIYISYIKYLIELEIIVIYYAHKARYIFFFIFFRYSRINRAWDRAIKILGIRRTFD